MNDRTSTGPHLAADDPRISEWIDGQLSATDAATVAAAVAASAELTRIVADLRAIKDTLGRLPAAAPPSSFTSRVIAALDAGPRLDHAAPDDAAIDSEWRRIEAERIAAEREEARDDLLDATPPKRRWPWLAFAAALAAGVIVALVLNSPAAVSRRMVASRPDVAAPAEAQPAAAKAPTRDAGGAERGQVHRQADEAAGPMATADEIVVVVRGAEGMAVLASLLDKAGIDRRDGPDGDEPVRGTGLDADGGSLDGDRLEIAGEPAAVGAFLAAVAALPPDAAVRLPSASLPQVAGTMTSGGGLGANAARRTDAPATVRRLVLRLVTDELAGASAGPSPESLDE